MVQMMMLINHLLTYCVAIGRIYAMHAMRPKDRGSYLFLGKVERRLQKHSLGFTERHQTIAVDVAFLEHGRHLLAPANHK